MLFSWWKSRRRRKLIERPFPDEWRSSLERNFVHWALLDDQEKLRMQHLLQVLLDEKPWTGCGGLLMTDEIRVSIAAQAALLILSIPHDYYDNVESILVYPSSYMLPRARAMGPRLLAEETIAVQGSAHYGGPVVLSWDSARSGGRTTGTTSSITSLRTSSTCSMAWSMERPSSRAGASFAPGCRS